MSSGEGVVSPDGGGGRSGGGRLRSRADLDRIRFDPRGLVPVIAQDVGNGRVLMLAWANREALERTLESGLVHFWSRSREAMWRKGETSGHVLRLASLHADCDGDTVLARVHAAGPACHTGEPTCFGALPASEAGGAGTAIGDLWSTLESRGRERPEGSYTARLLADENLRLKKLGEETAELVTALARGEDRVTEEAADLLYHILVSLLGAGRRWEEVEAVLRGRRGS